tara:strand:- start:1537 stop:2841 length:1305 start_codon:yes stop_codon:yes gene_type:complete
MALRLRRGTNAERLTVTPDSGEIIYVTDTKKLYVGDGATVGGNLVSGVNDIIDDVTPQLGGNLDLNGNNITGNGNINITGTINATGSINLGDGAGGDVITVGGEVSGNLIPTTDESFVLGSGAKRWTAIWASGLNVSGNITAESITADIISDDSTIVFDSSTNTFTGSVIGNVTGNVTGNLTGDIKGSVFNDDSTIIVDAVNGTLNGDVTGSVFANDGDNAYDADNKVFVAQTITANVKLNTPILDATNLVETAEVKAVGSSTHGILQLRYDNSGASVGDQVSLGRILFGDNDSGVNWTVDVTKDYMNFFPNYTGTPDYTKFAQVWQNGKFQIGGEAGGSGFQGMVREPNATLEVYGDALIGDISINQNTISMDDSNGNLRLATNGTGTIELDVPVQTTVGAAGAADALPATPSTYFKINVGGTDYVVPAYAVS